MKYRILLVVMVFGLIFTACSTNDPIVEPIDENVEEQVEMSVEELNEMANGESEVVDEMTKDVSFSRDLMPIFEKFAIQAHGSSGGVNLETYENVLKVVVPGSPEESRLYKHLTGDGVPVMPPSGKLDDETIQLFYDWIAAGAKDN